MIKLRAAIEMQAFQKVSCEKTTKLSQAIKIERSDTCPDGSLDLQHIDEAIFQIQGNHLASGRDAGTVQLVKDGAQLAEAPTQFSPGVIGNIAQKFAKAAATHRVGGQGQIAQQRPHLPGRWQVDLTIAARDRKLA